jgi:hypothetical protein
MVGIHILKSTLSQGLQVFFVFKGKFCAELINNPTRQEMLTFLNSYFLPNWESKQTI